MALEEGIFMLRSGMALAEDDFIEVMLPDDMVAWPWRRVPSLKCCCLVAWWHGLGEGYLHGSDVAWRQGLGEGSDGR